MPQLVYQIDDTDRIVAVGADWQSFADTNRGAHLTQRALVGRRLFDFIADRTVRDTYAAIVAHARNGRPVQFRFRCDAPAWRREFEMDVRATAPARVTFTSTLLRQESRPTIPLFEPPPANARPLVRMCSWCHAVADASGAWQPLEVAISALGLMEQGRHVGVTHGICPDCVERMFRAMAPADGSGSRKPAE